MSDQNWMKFIQNISRTVSMILSKYELIPPSRSLVGLILIKVIMTDFEYRNLDYRDIITVSDAVLP